MARIEEIEHLLARLASAPGRFAALLVRLEDADSITGTLPQEWSPQEILAHVRASNDILEPRLLQVLVRDEPPLAAYDERRWAEVARYSTARISDSLEAMRLRRRELVRALQSMSPGDWQRAGVHETRGRMTLLELARYVADHDDEHIAQLERVIGAEVGR